MLLRNGYKKLILVTSVSELREINLSLENENDVMKLATDVELITDTCIDIVGEKETVKHLFVETKKFY